MKELLYLACPYSHPNAVVREERFAAINRIAAMLMQEGVVVFSPISHFHPIAVDGELPGGWDFYEAFDRAFLERCNGMIVCCTDGWETSKGVMAEVQIARELGLPIVYLQPPYDDVIVRHVARQIGR